MSIMMSSPVCPPAAPAQPAEAASGVQAVQAAQAMPAVAGRQPAAATPTGTPSAGVAPFAQWLVQLDGAPAAADTADVALPSTASASLPPAFQATMQTTVAAATTAAGAPVSAAAGDSKPAAGDDSKPAADDGDSAVIQDGTMLAAMAMPLMPLTPMQIAQAVQSAQGNANAAVPVTAQDSGRPAATERSKAPARQPVAAAIGMPPATQDSGRPATTERSKAPAGQPAAADIGMPPAAQDSGRPAATERSKAPADQPVAADIALAQLPAQSTQAPRRNDGAVHLAVQAAAANPYGGANGSAANADAGTATQDSGADPVATPVSTTPAAGAVAGAPAAPQPAADTVKLAGPPTAWRQSLQEALGDRLHVQVGKNMEQAVIRLEPPQLGRIDIAIRHSNGTLEVNISASNGEVLRQLQTVSDSLRNDLAQRQFTDVAVSVTPTPKNNGASPFGESQQHQQQGRGRQQGRDQQEPGHALAEASHPTSAFSLGGRDA